MSRAEEAAGPEDPARRPASGVPSAAGRGPGLGRSLALRERPPAPLSGFTDGETMVPLEGNELIQDLVEGLDRPILRGGQRRGFPHPFPADLPSFLFQDLLRHPGSVDCARPGAR